MKISELKKEVEQLRHVGHQMANLCYNLSQVSDYPGTGDHCFLVLERNAKTMRELYKAWDAIPRTTTEKKRAA